MHEAIRNLIKTINQANLLELRAIINVAVAELQRRLEQIEQERRGA